jgi:hypothetical protein
MKSVRFIIKSTPNCGILASHCTKNCSNVIVNLGGIIPSGVPEGVGGFNPPPEIPKF